jgi:Flp pilus assembly protein TadD
LQEARYRLISLQRKADQAPGDASLHLQLAAELKRAGDAAGALRAYRKVLALDPSHRTARENLAALEAGSP